jgi:hydrogenase maturation protease
LKPENNAAGRIGVFGLGNVLMGDDALGPTVIAHLLAAYEVPPAVHVEDLGTPGLDLHPHLAGREHIILVDVVKSEGAPGDLRLYRRDEVLRHAPGVRVSPHDPGVKEALLALQFAGEEPRVLLVGVIPGEVAHAQGMTAAAKAAVPVAVKAVLDELERLGCAATLRQPQVEPDLWWEEKRGDDG